MRVPVNLANAFGVSFESHLAQFCVDQELLPDLESLRSPRHLTRSVLPHVQKLSRLFNRLDDQAPDSNYWRTSNHPKNFRAAYFLGFMPPNLFRMASVWSELHRLGYRWPVRKEVRAIEWGAGPAAGACGIAAGETFAPLGLPRTVHWALIEQDRAQAELGADWLESYSQFLRPDQEKWSAQAFHRKIDPSKGFLPKNAPAFDLWISSYFLNELQLPEGELADRLLESWNKHLNDEGMIILVEPALRAESRRLLTLRNALIERIGSSPTSSYKILLPCLGHQACGALAAKDDWCHEEVTWWRPPYLQQLDKLALLDRKTLPFSYLVLVKSRKSLKELLPALQSQKAHRLVSPAHSEGRDDEFFVCSLDGKQRVRRKGGGDLRRGDWILDSDVRGDKAAGRMEGGRLPSTPPSWETFE